MMLASPLDGIGVLDAAIVAVLGYAVVFFGLILLMIVIMVMGNIFIAKDKKREALNAAAKATIASVPVATPAAAPAAWVIQLRKSCVFVYSISSISFSFIQGSPLYRHIVLYPPFKVNLYF